MYLSLLQHEYPVRTEIKYVKAQTPVHVLFIFLGNDSNYLGMELDQAAELRDRITEALTEHQRQIVPLEYFFSKEDDLTAK